MSVFLRLTRTYDLQQQEKPAIFSLLCKKIFAIFKTVVTRQRQGKFMKLLFRTLFILLLTAVPLLPQEMDISFDHLTIKNGLSDGRIDCILQDSHGFLWFGTQDGLNRYDGYNFTVFGHDVFDSTSISSDWIRCILQDRQGQLWIGTEGGGLNRFNYETETFDRWVQDNNDENSLTDNFVRALYEDHNGVLWVGTRSGLTWFDREHETFIPFGSDSLNRNGQVFNENITEIIEDQDGDLWLGTSNDIYRIGLQRQDMEHYSSGHSERVTAIYQDSYGDIWIGSRYDGLKRYDPDTRRFTSFTNQATYPKSLSSNEIKDIYEDRNENLWIATIHGGLDLFERKTGTFHHYRNDSNDPSSLSNNSVRIIYQDRNGVIWLGMDGSGIDRFYNYQQKFRFYGSHLDNGKPLLNSTVLSITEDARGVLWIGTEGEGLVRFSRQNNAVAHFITDHNNPYSISSNQVTALLEDEDGVIWAGTKEGLNRYDPEKRYFHRYYVRTTPITGNNFINVIHPFDMKNLWLGTNGGLIRFEKNSGVFTPVAYDTSGLLTNEAVVSLWYEPEKDILWVGYLRSGLVAFYPQTGEYTHYRSDANIPNSLSSNFVQHIYRDSQKRLWIATRKGLDRFDPATGTFTRFDKNDGLPSNVIAGIVQDNNGDIWLSTTNGLSKFNLDRYLFTNYNIEDGLQGNQFWNRSCCRGRSGELFFGGNNGFNAFYPEHIEQLANPQIPPIVITSISVFNKPITQSIYPYVYGGDTLRLDYNRNQIFLEFAALDYISPGKNQFAYKLEGFETEWNYAGTRRFANYTNLDPGHYVFHVKGSNSDGVWNESGATLNIYIPKPFSRTWWAFVLYGAVAIGLVWGINAYIIAWVRVKHDLKLERMERKKAKEINQFKLQFFTDIAHEFKTPLTLIQAPLEEMLASARKNNPHADEMNLMYRNVRYLMRLVQQLLFFRRIENGRLVLKTTQGNLVEFTRRVFELFTDSARKRQIDYRFICKEETIEGWFDWERLEEILVNLIDNAMKYTPGNGRISVELDRKPGGTEQSVRLRVRDSGVGISDDEIEHIFERFYRARDGHHSIQASSGLGLALTKKLVEMHNGTINVESRTGEGCLFTVNLPLQSAPSGLEVSTEGSSGHLIDLKITDLDMDWEAGEKTLRDPEKQDRMVILIVEDDSELRTYMKKMLAKKFTIIEAKDGQEGLDTATSLMPNLIISDVLMPHLDGIQMCKKIKSQISTSHIPVILLSARSEVEDKIQGMEFGADDYIEKPFHFRFLDARINNILSSREMLRDRYRRELIVEPGQVKAFSGDEKLLVQIRDYVEEHLSDSDLGVNDLAFHVGVSRTMMFMKLKELIGYSPQEFIKVIRLKKAAQMLQKTDYTVSEIAYRVGFKYPKYFSTCFLQEYGKTPSEYRDADSITAVQREDHSTGK